MPSSNNNALWLWVPANAGTMIDSAPSDLSRRSSESEGGSVSRRTERRHIRKRGLAAHHLGQQPARGRPKRVTVMTMPEMHPQALVLRRRSNHWQHVRHAGADATPGFSLNGGAEIDQPPRRLFGTFEL